ncbi:MAG: DUF6088 family protein [Bacilli bacterium]
MTLSKQIKDRINASEFGSVFIVSDFTDISNYDTARRTLARLEEDRIIIKIHRGIYYKAMYSTLLNELIAPNMNTVAEAIARNFEWSITPTGENALNLLGISTQVPGHYSFISSGPYRNYTIGKTVIEFTHTNDKEINGKSFKTRLIIQAIKAIGKDRINEYIINFKKILTTNDKLLILKESQRTTSWIYAAIKEIAKEEDR